MYRNVLIATDGSELAQKAVDHGVAMAQATNAKVTVVTVSEPFHAFVVQPRMVTDTREQYERHVAACEAESRCNQPKQFNDERSPSGHPVLPFSA